MTRLLPTTTTNDEQERGARTAVLPVGSYEQHGPYLPLVTDTVIASVIARELASAYRVQVLPPITISCSHEHAAWPGTVSISSQTLAAVVGDVYDSVTRSGLSALVIVNGHGGNYVLRNLVQEGSAQARKLALFPSKEDWEDARRAGRLTTSAHEDMHAGELETSVLLHADPELVRDGYQSADWTADDRRHLLTIGLQEYTQSGVIGRPSLATAEKGKAVLDALTARFVAVLTLLEGA